MDSLFRIEVESATPKPQTSAWRAMKQDHNHRYVFDIDTPSEKDAGELVVRHCLEHGHFGVIEHPQISFMCGYFPHSTMQQLRTHRHLSFDVQSFRWTSKGFLDAAKALRESEYRAIEDNGVDFIALSKTISPLVYLRPVDSYQCRNGSYQYSFADFADDLIDAGDRILKYASRVKSGFSEEHARGLLPFDIRQHWVFSGNLRSMLHLMDLRSAGDAQIEIQWLCQLMWPHIKAWCPEISNWYEENRMNKNMTAKRRLSP